MQDQYVGDIGDYAKYALLRAIQNAEPNKLIGFAWYLRDNDGSPDGGKISYLEKPQKWSSLDSKTFNFLATIVADNQRHIQSIQSSTLFAPSTRFFDQRMTFGSRSGYGNRDQWFHDCEIYMRNADIVFADPDNGLAEGNRNKSISTKHIHIGEARRLLSHKIGVVYHHNTRRKGGHGMEITYWRNRLIQECGAKACRALYWRPFSPRTFFIINPTESIDYALEVMLNSGMTCRDGSNAIKLYGF